MKKSIYQQAMDILEQRQKPKSHRRKAERFKKLPKIDGPSSMPPNAPYNRDVLIDGAARRSMTSFGRGIQYD